MSLAIGLVGLGAIARAQHLPAIDAVDGVHLAAIASRNATLPDLPGYPDIESLLAEQPGIKAISLCTPPQGRFEQAMAVLQADRHLMLEKPPGTTVCEVERLRDEAARRGLSLFTTWHSREAAAVDLARDWLAGRELLTIRIDWREDVRKWHPGQTWIWQAGGLGVFDPGINALSILTKLLSDVPRVLCSDFETPANSQTPIAAILEMEAQGVPISAQFDWRETGRELWSIHIETTDGTATLDQGGARLRIGGTVQPVETANEYQRLYARFRNLVAQGQSEVDLSPLRLVADAFLNAKTRPTAAFHEDINA
ncbi:Gfo/Idh/MocA family oxidoreductase [Thioclava sp. BHET1]|nr:Gfo/Idh/MocA family oxidoreductase [Thioclava sp. BHET1]